jgi:hypothetical protein
VDIDVGKCIKWEWCCKDEREWDYPVDGYTL